MKPFDKMNTITLRLLILVLVALVVLALIPTSRFLYKGVRDAFETPIPKKKKIMDEEEEDE